MQNYYISDLHIGHANALRFDARPFKTVEEQDEVIIENINKTVTPQDNIYLLGDLSWYDPHKTAEFIKRINCKNRYLLIGNHDRWAKSPECKKLFQGIYELKMINDNGKEVVLCHYPLAVWNKSHRGSFHLYGHVHRNIADNGMSDNHTILNHPEMEHAINVGCMLDYMNYTPRTLDYLLSLTNNK